MASSSSRCHSISFFSIAFRFSSLYLLYMINSFNNCGSYSSLPSLGPQDLCFAKRFFFLCRGRASTIISSNSRLQLRRTRSRKILTRQRHDKYFTYDGSQLRWLEGGLKGGVDSLFKILLQSILRNNGVWCNSRFDVIRAPGCTFKSLFITSMKLSDHVAGYVGWVFRIDLTSEIGDWEWMSKGRIPARISYATTPSDHQSTE